MTTPRKPTAAGPATAPKVGIETLAFCEGKEPLTPLPDNASVRFAFCGGSITCQLTDSLLMILGHRDRGSDQLVVLALPTRLRWD